MLYALLRQFLSHVLVNYEGIIMYIIKLNFIEYECRVHSHDIYIL